MIVRVMGQGQWELADSNLAKLNLFDDLISKAVSDRDSAELAALLGELAAFISRNGDKLPSGKALLSDYIVPAADTDIDEVGRWLQESKAEDGFFPG